MPCKNKNGYTLLELALVLVVIGMTLSFSLPRFRQALLTDTLKSSARRLVGTVEELREKAIRQQIDWFLYFDLETDSFWSQDDDISKEELQKVRRTASSLAADVRVRDIWMRDQGSLSEGIVKIRFNKKGYVNQAIIHLEDESGRQMSLLLEPFLGTIKISEGYMVVE
jgi:prepilin-type N-terminal cleavage/methylation domain-containing protein